MRKQLKISLGQCSEAGRKPLNQDYIGASIPQEPLLTTKGVALAIADGISSSQVSQIASETAVTGFLSDYFSTSDSWSVKKSAERVLQATNSWLYSQSQGSPDRFNRDKGYVCTFSALIFKSHTAHLFHTGDTRIYRIAGDSLEQLTEDHRRQLDGGGSYLSRALGIQQQIDMQYRSFPVEVGDLFVLASDGVYENLSLSRLVKEISSGPDDLDRVAKVAVEAALQAGSEDNLSIQIARIEQLPDRQIFEIQDQVSSLSLPPALKARSRFDGYEIEREIYISSRSHVFLAVDEESGDRVVIKTPSTEMRDNSVYLERFMMEDWIARRVDNAHVLKAIPPARKRDFLYLTTEYLEGQNLAQWMRDNPSPSLEDVRDIVEQIAKGLQAFHRQEMIHQDLRPNNVMIDRAGTVKIIDFGAVKVAGIDEINPNNEIQGTAQYTAPEYFIGREAKARSDLFSLGVICYQMLTGELPYGTAVSRATTLKAQLKLSYKPLTQKRKDIPAWVDHAIKQCVMIDPLKRYQAASEFTYDLRHPNKQFLNRARPPLMERDPLAFWQGVSLMLAVVVVLLLCHIHSLT